MIRVGIPGMPGSVGLGAGWIALKLLNRYGAGCVGLAVPDDLVVVGTVVDSLPLRIGTGTLANATANRFTFSTRQGRRFLSPGTVDAKDLSLNNSVGFKTIIAVAYGTAVVNTYETIASSYTGDEPLTRNATTSTFLGGTWTRSVDGDTPNVTKSIPTSGLHVFHSYYASSALTGFRVGGNGAAVRTWPADVGLVAFLSVTPTAQNIADDVVDLRRYYRGLIA